MQIIGLIIDDPMISFLGDKIYCRANNAKKAGPWLTSRSLNVLKDSHKRAADMYPAALLPQKISSAVLLSALLRIIDNVLH